MKSEKSKKTPFQVDISGKSSSSLGLLQRCDIDNSSETDEKKKKKKKDGKGKDDEKKKKKQKFEDSEIAPLAKGKKDDEDDDSESEGQEDGGDTKKRQPKPKPKQQANKKKTKSGKSKKSKKEKGGKKKPGMDETASLAPAGVGHALADAYRKAQAAEENAKAKTEVDLLSSEEELSFVCFDRLLCHTMKRVFFMFP